MSNKINMGLSVMNDSSRKSSGPLRQLTLEVVIEWIKYQELDDYTTNGLIEMAKKYPTQALGSFRKNFNLMIQRVRAKRKQERGSDNANTTEAQTPVSLQERLKQIEDFDAWEQQQEEEHSENGQEESGQEVVEYGQVEESTPVSLDAEFEGIVQEHEVSAREAAERKSGSEGARPRDNSGDGNEDVVAIT